MFVCHCITQEVFKDTLIQISFLHLSISSFQVAELMLMLMLIVSAFLISAFKSAPQMTQALMSKQIQAFLIDNYALTRFSNYLQNDHIRLHTVFEHKINYGLVMSPYKGAEKTVNCVKRYLKNYNHDVFDYMARQLKPISVGTAQFHLFH